VAPSKKGRTAGIVLRQIFPCFRSKAYASRGFGGVFSVVFYSYYAFSLREEGNGQEFA
jgi:hypothetical protein